MPILTQNSELRPDHVWNFTLPAWVVQLPDGSHFNVCPSAGVCSRFCYARNGTYLFSNVKQKHMANLDMVMNDPNWIDKISEELTARKFKPKGVPRVINGLDSTDHLDDWTKEWIANGGAAIRIHDSGDFFSEDYLLDWIEIARRHPSMLTYMYTKEIHLLRKHRDDFPPNLQWVISMGGKYDALVDKDTERHSDVFPDLATMEAAGYMSQHKSDLLCVLLPTTRIGIPANNIRHFNKKLAGRTFSEAQEDRKSGKDRKPKDETLF